jgi:transcriptional regulator with XRE-family HTH domain
MYAAKKIKQARRMSRKSQVKMGKQLGVSDKTVSAWESGRAEPSLDMLYNIGSATNQPINFFFRDQTGEYTVPSKLSEIASKFDEIREILERKEK